VEFTTAWLLEKSLSVDNLFVFALIFGYFKVPREYQHRVLFFGVLGALVFRGVFLALGVAIVSTFTAVLFVFAAVLLYSAYKLLKDDDATFDPGSSIAVRLLRKVIPVREEYAGTKFVVRAAGRRVATPLLAVVVAIEAADLVFAVDSVPAVLAVSDDAFIVYSSNAFAILGLRALYFLLSGLLEKFHYLSKGLALILAFIGVKLVLQASHKVISQPRRDPGGARGLGAAQSSPAGPARTGRAARGRCRRRRADARQRLTPDGHLSPAVSHPAKELAPPPLGRHPVQRQIGARCRSVRPSPRARRTTESGCC